jgi:23S rRNA (pseudouridine1915-N3)-methyltransferase
MKVSILAVGRLKNGPEQTLFNRYMDMFNASARQLKIPPIAVIEVPEGRADTAAERKAEEAHDLQARLAPGVRVVALDETGEMRTSTDFTAMISRLRDEALDVAFVVGGPDGHSDAFRQSAHFKLSLSRMTLPHGLARIMLAEQLYRAVSIMQGHPYHRA